MLLTVRGDRPAQQYDLYVRDDVSQEVIFHSGFQKVEKPNIGAIDITNEPLKIALKLTRGGKFSFLMVGVIGDVEGAKPAMGATQMFWAGRLEVNGTASLEVMLLTVPAGDDQDRDLWPDAAPFLAHVPAAGGLYADKMDLLDCDDKNDMPMSSTGVMLTFKAADINPFAREICNDGFDQNCNGNVDEACVDDDGDGDFAGSDCDDKDPARHHATAKDPFPDPKNCCGYSLGKAGTADATHDYLGDPDLCPMKRCGDGIDESCSGADTTCTTDDDCDTYPAGIDCDDKNPAIHPGALEICGNDIDEDCDGVKNNGCVPCDLDGDGFERLDPANNCNPMMGKIDCNDDDAGVFPGSTSGIGSKEVGLGAAGPLTSALRGYCRRVYEPTGINTMGTPKIGPAGTVGDADCNGVVFEGCPSAACDVDGDGFPNAGAGCNPGGVALDCNDANPQIFPGAPDKCGNGIAENCAADSPCGGNDKDGDGYATPFDCNDANKDIHPFAVELCNGVDDDCDGLTDEGNPDPTGKPMVMGSAVISCTTSDIGECAKTKGKCVCSVAPDNAKQDPQGRRMFCPGETSGASKPPKCYGSGQPKLQSCNAVTPLDDDCDERVDAPDGKNLMMLGMPCGITQGQCKAGTVTGCDMTKPNPFATFGRIPASQAWLQCSSPDTVYPKAELCNGFDDDCDGVVPGMGQPPPIPGTLTNDEADHDGDKYLACQGCGANPLAPGKMGCGDCDDTRAATFPGAPDTCNNIDDDCVPATLDGANECGGANPPTCCSAQSACRNLTNDRDNCNGCGVRCDYVISGGNPSPKANACAGSTCVCGGGPACGSGQWCDPTAGPSCQPCNVKGHCGPSCVACANNDVCNATATACTGCNVDTDCMAGNYCLSGTCTPKVANGLACSVGTRACTSGPDQAGGCPTCTGGSCNTCQSGLCVDGVCCSATCGTCSRCLAGAGNGNCINVVNADDPDTCTGVNTCNASAMCRLKQGQGCSLGTQCATGNCVDGACCNVSACATCRNCAVGGGTCSITVSSAKDDTANVCNGNNICNGSGTCLKDLGVGCGGGAECATGNCVDGVCCNVSACPTCRNCGAGTGTCSVVVTNGNDNSATSCNGNNTCNGTGTCLKALGQGCGGGGECASGNCVDGVCCNVSACPTCRNCASGTGLCSTVVTGDDATATTCSGNNTCSAGGVCLKAFGQG